MVTMSSGNGIALFWIAIKIFLIRCLNSYVAPILINCQEKYFKCVQTYQCLQFCKLDNLEKLQTINDNLAEENKFIILIAVAH